MPLLISASQSDYVSLLIQLHLATVEKKLIKFNLFIILTISRDSGSAEGETVYVKLC